MTRLRSDDDAGSAARDAISKLLQNEGGSVKINL